MRGTKITPSKDRKLMMEMAIKPPTQAVKREQRKQHIIDNFQTEICGEQHKATCWTQEITKKQIQCK